MVFQHLCHDLVMIRYESLLYAISFPCELKQGVFSGVLISKDFKYWFPETKKANISGITSSCFAVNWVSTRC
jgi:hypothetical protein